MSDKSGKSPKKGGMRKFFKDRAEERQTVPQDNLNEDEEAYLPLKGYLHNLPPLPEEFLLKQQRKDRGCSSSALPPYFATGSPDSTSSIISSSIDFDYSFNSQVNSAGQDNINNDDHNSIDFDIHDNLHVNNDSVIVESNVNKFCADNLNAPFKSDSESSISNQTPDKNTGTSSKRTPKHLKRKRKSFVDPLRRQKKLNKIYGRKRLTEGSPGKILHNERIKASNVKTRSSRPLSERDVERENARKNKVRNRNRKVTVREIGHKYEYNLIGLDREKFNYIISNQPSITLNRDFISSLDNNMANTPISGNPYTGDRRTFSKHNLARAQVTSENPSRVSFGLMSETCEHCDSLNFAGENFNCCEHGKVHLPALPVLPESLEDLYRDVESPDSRNFLQNIRRYNSLFSFASTTTFNRQSDLVGAGGPRTIRICGNYRHRISPPHPGLGHPREYSQLYLYCGQDAVDARQQIVRLWDINLSRRVLHIIQTIMDDYNPYSAAYRHMYQVEIEERQRALEEGYEIPAVYMEFLEGPDRRRYNAPINNEVAAIFTSRDGAPPARTFVVHTHQEGLRDVNILSQHLDSLSYPILFPSGGHGYHLGIPHYEPFATATRNHVTMREYVKFYLCEREKFNPILFSRLLFQQYLVDSYCKIEQNNLNYIRHNQKKIYTDQYSSLIDYIEQKRNSNEDNIASPGRLVILPSSFPGSPRAMHQLYQDAMSAVAHFGKPSLFVTMTCNPNWPEILDMRQGRQASDMPHIVSRVFNMYLKALVDDIWSGGVLGKTVHQIKVIEFQKRGLPHAHILLKLAPEDELVTSDDIDSLICAEIPDKKLNPLLHHTVTTSMLHGPCGARCLVDGKCSKNFPKPFCEETIVDVNGYPIYRRRDMPDRIFWKGDFPFDNRYVVPYCPYLSQKFNCHINVESCNSIKAIKYLHKYVYKGYDCASVRVREVYDHDEIDHYVNGRYISAPEAAWRIHGFKMHDQSHNIIRLSVHDENRQNIYFQEGSEEEALQRLNATQLEAWFNLNREDVNARHFLYTEIPLWYYFGKGEWHQRKRKVSPFTLVRMYSVSPRDVARFHLRLLLLHVKGATSFEDLRTVQVNGNKVIFQTFREACVARGLVNDDGYLRQTLSDAVQSQMPRQLRSLYAYLLLYCNVESGLDLWEEFKQHLCEDLLQRGQSAGLSVDECYAEGLRNVQSIVEGCGKLMADFDLPTSESLIRLDDVPENQSSSASYDNLNAEQREIADAVIQSVNRELNEDDEPRIFFVDGPGGTGKSYLFNFLSKHFQNLDKTVIMCAWSGVAATLLVGGKTVHSTFKIPLNANNESTSLMNRISDAANSLISCSLFVIDEVSMMDIDSLCIIDSLLRELTGSDIPFGGKTVVFGGDFRQTLPIVVRGSEGDIVSKCVLSSELWSLCKHYHLRQNMRAEHDLEFASFILSIGDDTCPRKVDDPFKNCISLPKCCVVSNVVDSTFPVGLDPLQAKDSVILTPTNETALRVNDLILDRINGEEVVSVSADSVECEDIGDEFRYEIEYLNSLNFTGLPPHRLHLKIDCAVMLLRNLHAEGGLCNGTRLIVKKIYDRYLICETVIGGRLVMIPKIVLSPARTDLPFKLKRLQFPVRLAYCITINKSQGQTIKNVGILLEKPVFGHGQLYVALSRATSFENLKIEVIDVPGKQGSHDGQTYTANVVYRQLSSLLNPPTDETNDTV